MQQLPPGFVIDGQPEQGAPSNTVITKRANPAERRGTDLRNQMTEVQIQKLLSEMSKGDKPQTIQRKDGSIVQVTQGGQIIEVAGPTVEPGGAGAPKPPEQLEQIRADALEKIALARDLANRSRNGYFTTGFGSGLAGSLRGTDAYDLAQDTDTIKNAGALQRIMEMAATNGGKNPLTPLSNADFQALASSLTNLDPGQSDAQYQKNLKSIEDLYMRAFQSAGGQNIDEGLNAIAASRGLDISRPEDKKRDDMAVAGNIRPDTTDRNKILFGDPPSDNQNGGFVPYGAETRLEHNPQWKGVNEAVKGMIVSGRPAQEIKAFMNSKGIAGDAARGVDDAINYYRKTGKQDFGVDVENIQVPMSGFDQFRNNAPQTRVGTAAATALNAGGFGIPQMLAGGEGLDYLRQQNPGSAFAGDVAGVIGGTAALGKAGSTVAGKLAPSLLGGGGKAAAGRQLATDVGYGAIYGATTEGTPQGALTGALTAGLGSAGGQAIGKGIQTLGRGVNAPGAAQLYDQGITPTLGQIGRSRGGIIGNTLGGLEDRISGIPFVGEAVGNARNRGLQQSNVSDLNNALRPVGGTVNDFGTEGYAAADDVIGEAYQAALDPMRLQVDDGLRQAMDSVPQYRDIIEQNLDNGMMTGRGFQAAKRTIDGEIAAASGAPMGYKTLPPLQTLRDSMFQSAEAQAPDLLQQYRLADEAYNNLVPIRAATAAAENTGGIYTPAQLGRSLRSTDRSVGKRATARGDRPGQDMQTLKQEILPSKVPDSGTVGRGIVAAGVGIPALGGATVNPLLAGLALPAAAYTKIGQDLVAKALLAERPKLVRQGAGIFGGRKARKALSGAITAPLLTDY